MKETETERYRSKETQRETKRWERERDRHSDREKETETWRDRDRETQRQTDTEAERSSVTDGWGVGRCRQPCVRGGSWFPAPGCSRRCGIGLGICVLGRGQGALRVAWGGRLLQP